MARSDLDWLSERRDGRCVNVQLTSCDLWEETEDRQFLWNRAMMQAALLEGAELALEDADAARHELYLKVVQDCIGNPFFSNHAEFDAGSFLTECPTDDESDACKQYQKRIDGAVILSLVHSRPTSVDASSRLASFVPSATSHLVADTVKAYNEVFCDLYEINRKDSEINIPGVLYGRYALDKYGSQGAGNPWVLISASLASLFYQAAQQVGTGCLESPDLDAWNSALNVDESHPFKGSAQDFIAAGDSVLARLRTHISDADEMHLYEQIDRQSGKQHNAKDLSWSYAEVLMATLERLKAVSAMQGIDLDSWVGII